MKKRLLPRINISCREVWYLKLRITFQKTNYNEGGVLSTLYLSFYLASCGKFSIQSLSESMARGEVTHCWVYASEKASFSSLFIMKRKTSFLMNNDDFMGTCCCFILVWSWFDDANINLAKPRNKTLQQATIQITKGYPKHERTTLAVQSVP